VIPGGPRLLLAGTLVAGGAFGVATLPDPVAAYPQMLAWLTVSTLGWALAVHLLAQEGAAPELGGRVDLAIVVGVGLAARLALTVPAVPPSDDLYRYLWEGRIGNAGINPFLHAPDSEALAAHRDDEIWPRINHPDIPTIYPPVAQLFFRTLDGVWPDARSPRAAAAVLDTITVLLLAGILRRRGRSATAAAAYAWCPLVILETGGGGHVDAVGVTLLVAGLAVADRTVANPRLVAAGLLLGLSMFVKPMVPLAVPALLARRPWRGNAFLFAGAAIAMLTILLYVDAGERLFTAFRTYALNWRFNDAVYSPLVSLGVDPRSARLALAGTTGLIALALPFRLRDPIRAAAVAFAAALLLSPTVHPWYALWLAALLPFAPRVLTAAIFTFLALLPITYYSAWSLTTTGEWVEPGWVGLLVWGGPGVVMISDALRRRRAEP